MANTAAQTPTYINPIIWNSKLLIHYITNLALFHIQWKHIQYTKKTFFHEHDT
jgi:hypothetical protein